jgi:hypothetical protein
MNHANEREWDSVHGEKHSGQSLAVGKILFFVELEARFHPIKVAAPAKGFSFASEHHGSVGFLVFGQVSKQSEELIDESFIESIPHFGAIEAHFQNAPRMYFFKS